MSFDACLRVELKLTSDRELPDESLGGVGVRPQRAAVREILVGAQDNLTNVLAVMLGVSVGAGRSDLVARWGPPSAGRGRRGIRCRCGRHGTPGRLSR